MGGFVDRDCVCSVRILTTAQQRSKHQDLDLLKNLMREEAPVSVVCVRAYKRLAGVPTMVGCEH